MPFNLMILLQTLYTFFFSCAPYSHVPMTFDASMEKIFCQCILNWIEQLNAMSHNMNVEM